jgi:hypothetical protein
VETIRIINNAARWNNAYALDVMQSLYAAKLLSCCGLQRHPDSERLNASLLQYVETATESALTPAAHP